MFNRIKNILVTPKTEWPVIEGENKPHLTVLITYVLILAAIPAVAAIIGYGIIGYNVLGIHVANFSYAFKQAVSQYIVMTGGVYLSAFVIDLLAGTFGAQKNFDKAFSLVAYAWTPMFVGGVFHMIPGLRWLPGLVGLYAFFLLYVGLKPMMKVADDKQTGYFVVSLLAMLVAYGVLTGILVSILGISMW